MPGNPKTHASSAHTTTEADSETSSCITLLSSVISLAGPAATATKALAMLTIDGRLGVRAVDTDELVRYALTRLRTGVAQAR